MAKSFINTCLLSVILVILLIENAIGDEVILIRAGGCPEGVPCTQVPPIKKPQTACLPPFICQESTSSSRGIFGIQGSSEIINNYYNIPIQVGNISSNILGEGASANINIGGVQSYQQ